MTSGLEAIRQRIIAMAKKQAEALVQQALDEKRDRISSAEREARTSAASIIEDAKAEAEKKHEERLGAIRTDLRRQILTRREELMDSVWERAMHDLRDYMEGEEYRSSLKKLVVEAARSIGGESFRVDANARDLPLIAKSKDEIEKALEEAGSPKKMILGRVMECIGGVEVSDPERRVVLDRTYDAKVRKVRAALRAEIARIIAGGLV